MSGSDLETSERRVHREQAGSNGAPAPDLRLPGESPKAYAAFLAYRDLGPERSLRRVARRLSKSLALMKRWSSRHRWPARVLAWDQQHRAEEEDRARRAADAAYERRVANAEQLERVAMAGLRSLMVRDPATGEVRFAQGLKPTDIAALIRVACRLLPTAPQEVASEDEEGLEAEALGRLSREDLDLLLRMLEEKPREGNDDDTDH